MATLKPKAKSKKPGKASKSDARNHDLSNLRQPIETSVTNFKEVAKLFESATPEIKDLLTHEVNVLYECRICRSIYRSLLNIVSHKRAFCKEKVKVTTENKTRDDQSTSSNVTLEDLQSLEVDESTFEMLDKPTENGRILRSQAPCKSQKKDLTSVVHMLQKKQEENSDERGKQNQNDTKVQAQKDDCDQVVLQVMESKTAAFQTLLPPNMSPVDLMENQVLELDSMSNQNRVTLGNDGIIEKSDSPVHFYNNEEETTKLVCEICYRQFSTRKTLNSHMKILHAPVRVCYLCPLAQCSNETFANPASVKRHLTNVHKKIGKELKELGERIEEKIMRMKPLGNLSNKKSKKLDNTCKNTGEELQFQEWMEPVDPQVEFHDCSLCGERFDCKMEFKIHLQNCIGHSDVRSPEEIATFPPVLQDEEDCEVVISEQENFVEPSTPEERETVSQITSPLVLRDSTKKDSTLFMPIRVQGISSLNLEDWENLPQWSQENEKSSSRVNAAGISLPSEVTLTLKRTNKPVITDTRILGAPEIIYTSVDNTKKRKVSSLIETIETNGHISQGERWKKSNREIEVANVVSGRTSAQNLEAKIALISDQPKLECIRCKRSFTTLSSLQRHLESHIKLNRYRCNKCNYKSGTRNDCIGHCNRMHNAMNNRQVLNEMISTIPLDQLTISQEIDVSNLNMHDMSQSSSDADSRIGIMSPITYLIQKNRYKLINPSDTETKSEDRNYVRKLDLRPDLNEIMEIIGDSNSTLSAPKTDVYRVNQSWIQNINLEKSNEKDDYSPALGEINCNTNYPDEEDEISCEFHSRSRSNSRTRNSRAGKIYESRSGSRMKTRSSSRLGKKLDSDEDESAPELCRTRSRNSNRSRSTNGTRSESRNQSTIVTRSRSRSRSQNDSYLSSEENQEDPWKGYSRDLSYKSVISRPRSRAEKETKSSKVRSVSSQSRGKRRGRPPGRGNKCRSISRGRKERSESFSSENSQIQRPVRNRIKHVDKDFVYDMENVPFRKELSYSSSNSSGNKTPVNQFAQDEFNSSHTASKSLFDETDDLEFIREISRASSSSDLENSELNFRGFPRQTEIMNVE